VADLSGVNPDLPLAGPAFVGVCTDSDANNQMVTILFATNGWQRESPVFSRNS
jgi:hypothetical protein